MRNYSSVAAKTALQADITALTTNISVGAVTGFPSVPFTLIIDVGQVNEEAVTVNAIGGTTLTVSRAQDGTTATSHLAGAAIEHMMTARDLQEPQTHIAATSAAHGVTGNLVGTTDTQSLTNKTLTGPTVTSATLNGTTTNAGTIAGGTLGSNTVSTATLTGTTTNSGTITGGTISGVAVNTAVITGSTFTGGTIANPTISTDATIQGNVEIGAGNANAYVDFHCTAGAPNDRDARLLVSGGSSGTNDTGTLTATANGGINLVTTSSVNVVGGNLKQGGVQVFLANRIAFGTALVTMTAGNGTAGPSGNIAHGLGAVPGSIQLTGVSLNGNVVATIYDSDATNFRISIQRTDGGLQSSTGSYTVHWFAII